MSYSVVIGWWWLQIAKLRILAGVDRQSSTPPSLSEDSAAKSKTGASAKTSSPVVVPVKRATNDKKTATSASEPAAAADNARPALKRFSVSRRRRRQGSNPLTFAYCDSIHPIDGAHYVFGLSVLLCMLAHVSCVHSEELSYGLVVDFYSYIKF